MIVATAGHVDHGKTSLVKALTGTDTDTLEEEKRRGLTITPGFAYFDVKGVDTGPARVGFVDVPGHHQFIHNMLSGVSGIDAVLLVIAANEGIKPQTAEHLRIMDLLKVRYGLLAVTKTDRIDAASLSSLEDELRIFTRGTFMEHAPMIRTSTITGEGVEELRDSLAGLAAYFPERPVAGNFRLAIDRAFTLKGIGVVVTGTVHDGRIEPHEELVIAPANIPARIRGIYSENEPTAAAVAGHRCAINLSGVELSEIKRGDWLTTSDANLGTSRIDVKLELPANTRSRLRHSTPVHVFHGATHVTGRMTLLEDGVKGPRENQLAQLSLDKPLVAVHGDICIVRNQASDETLAGAIVVDIFAPMRGRASAARLSRLRGLQIVDHAAGLQAMLAYRSESVSLEAFRLNRNLTPQEANTLYKELGVAFIEGESDTRGLHPEQWQALQDEILAQVGRWHDNHSDIAGINLNQLNNALDRSLEPAAIKSAIRASIRKGAIKQSGPYFHLPGFECRLRGTDAEIWGIVRSSIAKAGDRPPTVRELAVSLNMETELIAATLKEAERAGLAIPVESNRYFLPGHIEAMAGLLTELSSDSDDGLVTTTSYRDASGLGRNLAIAVLEYFDSIGITRRIGNARRLMNSTM